MATFTSSFKLKLIYVFRINDEAHKGCLKVGETTYKGTADPLALQPNCSALNEAARERIDQYTSTAGVAYDLLHTELTFMIRNGEFSCFNDGEVHKIMRRSGIRQKFFSTDKKANEWFITDLATVKNAITAAKEGRTSLTQLEISADRSPIVFRPEQAEAIKLTRKRFKTNNQYLWNAKMRFGKTLSALQVVKEEQFDRTLILTHRPVVDAGWFEDFQKIFYDTPGYAYGSRTNGETFDSLERMHRNGRHYVYFASMQDLRGSELVGGSFDKNIEIFSIDWDFLIVDEAHEGTKTELGQNVMRQLTKENTKVLQLSGTPFNLFEDFKQEEIYTWDYVMEQRAKQQWDSTHWGDPNPYAALPQLNIYTYDLGLELKKYQDEEHAFNFSEFFRVGDDGKFLHDTDIDRFLDLLATESDNDYPYSKKEWRNNFRHSLWTVPSVAAAKALSEKIRQHQVLGFFKVVNVAGEGDTDADYESDNALEMVKEAIGDRPEETYTITLSRGRLTTGVSVPAWTAVFMLHGSRTTRASSYMQTIFRAQTPAIINGKQKQDCFVFDFAPDRTLKVLAETAKVSAKAGKTTDNDRIILGDFLNFCPVISFHGSQMTPIDVPQMMRQLKRVYVERVVSNGFEDTYLYNDKLLQLDQVELERFANLRAIIGQTKAMKRSDEIDINNQGFTNEEYEEVERLQKKPKKQLTPEEVRRLEELKEKKIQRNTAISILRGISIRMPMMIYGAELTDENAEITIGNFTQIVDDASWEEFMPKGVTKERFEEFKQYYDEDIFAEAGKRIRLLARRADEMDIEDRIEQITSIFNSFRNPDKETVLTPWRVVNLHLGDTLGGWNFLNPNRLGTDSIPHYVDNGAVTADVFGKDTRILEINSKSGLYPLYAAYSVYRNRIEQERMRWMVMADAEQQRIAYHKRIWKEVLADNIFVVCKTPMAKSITARTLRGFDDSMRINAHAFDDLLNLAKNEPQKLIRYISNPNKFNPQKPNVTMKFNAVIGNPPYQLENKGNGTGADPIYHLFIDIATKLGEKSTLIHPARFLFNAGKTPKEWNQKMLNDEHFKVVDYFVNSSDVFPTVDVKGGIAITLYDRISKFKKIGVFSAHKELTAIVEKVTSREDFVSFKNLVYSRDLYKLTEKLYEENPWAEGRQSEGHRYDVGSGVFDVFPELFFDECPNDAQSYAMIYGRIGTERCTKWVKKSYLKLPDNFDSYKIFIPKTNGTGAIGEVLSTPVVGLPVVGHTVTFLSIGKFVSELEAEACLKYVKSKFARTLLGSLKVTQDNPRDTWANVPLQDFTSGSDIDWSKSVEETDRQLYAKYGLSEAEVSFIERMVKKM